MKKTMKINHDKIADVLYIVFGENRPSYADDIGNDVYVRYAIDDDELIGITILDFSKRSKADLIDLIVSEHIITQDNKEVLDLFH